MITKAQNVLMAAAGFLLIGGAHGQTEKQDQAAEPATRQVQAEDVLAARIIIDDLAEQMRISQAKLDPEALERKRKIGRTETLLKAADSSLQALAARTQRLVERHDERREQLTNLMGLRKTRGMDVARVQELIRQSEQEVTACKERLDRVARYRAQLQTQLEDLKAEHLTWLLEAASQTKGETKDAITPLEQLIGAEPIALQELIKMRPEYEGGWAVLLPRERLLDVLEQTIHHGSGWEPCCLIEDRRFGQWIAAARDFAYAQRQPPERIAGFQAEAWLVRAGEGTDLQLVFRNLLLREPAP